ncbi:MAG: thymidine phosphorylase [Pseudomonadota bacterium]
MDARGILRKLRQNTPLSNRELQWFADGLASGAVSDAQAGAFAMATCLNGMSEAERVALTLAMRDSGDVLAWDLPGPVVDKHSTGGLGDCTSLLLAPILAEAGAYVPMISGRGLGHTGGTLDKLEAIPGFNVEQDEAGFRRIVGDVGCAIVAASGDLAPADRRLYAVRDVTSTVESIDLITASILSKKLAAGLEVLVLDVKLGSGAFMETAEAAQALAQSLVTTANGAGCRTEALLTDMNQPLAPALGNALEIATVRDALRGAQGYAALIDVTVALCGSVLALAGLAGDAEEGAATARAILSDGRAAERFQRMVAAQGGPSDLLELPGHLATAPVIRDVPAPADGVVAAIDGRALGMAVVRLGGGRMKGGDPINPAVGFDRVKRIGARVSKGEPLLRLHAANAAAADAAKAAALEAFTLGGGVDLPVLVHGRVTA